MIYLLTLLLCLLPVQSWAAVGYGTTGTGSGGTTSLSLAQPASIAAGDLLIMCIGNKYPTNGPATPTGYTAPTNNQASGDDGLGTGTNDQGATYGTLFYRIADGAESGNVAVTITSGNSAYGVIIRYTNATANWSVAAVQGGDSSSGTDYSATMNAGVDIAVGDLVIACSGKTVGSTNTATVEAVASTGVTYGAMTERHENATSFGDNSGVIISEHPISSGSSSDAPVYTYTYGTNVVGGTVLFRIREAAAVGGALQPASGFLGGIIK